jgi:hypothetical protein
LANYSRESGGVQPFCCDRIGRARAPGSGTSDHILLNTQPAAAQRVVVGMPISRLLCTSWSKLLAARSASRAAAAQKATAQDVARKQMLMQQLGETLHAGRARQPK